ncbi:MAG: nucleotidyl transferase AbiEii/AbiGii toxin family protein [Erysipelotrichaceae bacterium]|nr:nucleotidyl transferase AbiEii/AbiGii toxin family protein [Erysipelotrichaceae bacterium]
MIKTATQLKALIRNKANKNSGKAQLLIRNYAMERFLERVSVSEYKDNFIVKGGILVTSMVGLDNRATMDIDTTIVDFSLDEKTISKIIEDISGIELGDNITFDVKSIESIMDEAEYNGFRFIMNAYLDKTRIPMKIDVSTGDVITPKAIQYSYPLMFEERSITLWAYNLETVLAEKLETIISRGTANSRMRDYYDVWVLQNTFDEIDSETLRTAFTATCLKRNSPALENPYEDVLAKLEESQIMKEQWDNYRVKNSYSADLNWNDALSSVKTLMDRIHVNDSPGLIE